MAGQDTENPFYLFYYLGFMGCPSAEMAHIQDRNTVFKALLPLSSWNIYSRDAPQNIAENTEVGVTRPSSTP